LILNSAGDNLELMNAPSAISDTYSENKILYKKTIINSVEVFEFSTNPLDVLFNVKFTSVGNNLGNYIVSSTISNGRIFKYVEPIAGVLQGNYEPKIKLIAPTKLQIATILGKYNPTDKTLLDFEMGLSNNDQNLFSPIDDSNNKGLAGKINVKQRLFSKKWQVDAIGNYQFTQKNFKTIERLFSIEFDRDWNLNEKLFGNQSFLTAAILFTLPEKSNWKYQYENLNFSDGFLGNRHITSGFFKFKNWIFSNNNSLLKSEGNLATSKFLRSQLLTKYNFNKNWVGGSFRHENNQEKIKLTNQFSSLSQRFSEIGAFIGRGDSTKVYVELGYLHRANDSLFLGELRRVNVSNSYYLKSKLVQNEKTDLSLFINYRNLKFEDPVLANEPSLNSRLLYNDKFFKQFIQITVAYETTSGSIPQQQFSFLEVEAGQGIFAWNDYNGNGIQEIQEFEISPFPDKAKYVKIFLPNQIFIKTHQNKFSQSVTLNPSQWQNEKGFKKIMSLFYNQTSYLIERKIKRQQDNFDLNPFSNKTDGLLGLNASIRNSLFFNRGKQNHSVTYTYVSNKLTSFQSSGAQESNNISHQLQYNHLLKKYWLFNFTVQSLNTSVNSENYQSRNFEIKGKQLESKISYLFDKNTSLDLFYEYQNKNNVLGDLESLKQNKLGTSFNFASEKKLILNGEFSMLNNNFKGLDFSPVAFQMLEGLQSGKNLTWRLLIQKNLTQFLDININYQGRKSENIKTIHTGNIQLRAYF
uniref:hypothetical protein n=1 Tax=Flavobacterium sp. TaxID=239 RepID=UPI0037509CE1